MTAHGIFLITHDNNLHHLCLSSPDAAPPLSQLLLLAEVGLPLEVQLLAEGVEVGGRFRHVV